jgi:hypothetical protein
MRDVLVVTATIVTLHTQTKALDADLDRLAAYDTAGVLLAMAATRCTSRLGSHAKDRDGRRC